MFFQEGVVELAYRETSKWQTYTQQQQQQQQQQQPQWQVEGALSAASSDKKKKMFKECFFLLTGLTPDVRAQVTNNIKRQGGKICETVLDCASQITRPKFENYAVVVLSDAKVRPFGDILWCIVCGALCVVHCVWYICVAHLCGTLWYIFLWYIVCCTCVLSYTKM